MLRLKWFKTIAYSFVQNYFYVDNSILYQQFTKQFVNENGLQVISGPFTGLKYPSLEAYGSALLPKLMGTYEHELHHLFEDLKIRKDYYQIIDIGAAEGYYAIGLTKLFPSAKFIAFESSEKARILLNNMAILNEVIDDIQLEKDCNTDSLKKVLKPGKGLIICDCEGYELNLLDPNALPLLNNYDLLIELHDYSFKGKTVAELMQERFEKTHSFKFINIRTNKPLEHLKNFNPEQLAKIADENRAYSIGWAFFEANKINS